MNLDNYPCPCGECDGPTKVPPRLIAILEKLESILSAETYITSGVRCPEHNAVVGGARFSRHLNGDAIDIFVPGVEADAVYYLLDEAFPDRFGIGKYKRHTHLDLRPNKARWDLT